ncbi:hypothetical protein D6817_00095 [Candidatus Pacearchaeota archaeon]|nr:MAG: hypothetical protein D6817_00095 [Candidatus Pacearchaeota archaeon]
MEIIERDVERAWKKALQAIFTSGADFVDKDGRVCRELLNLSITLISLKKITKPIEIINSSKEWIYPSLEELESIMLSKDENPGYYYTYGSRAFNFDGLDQINDYVIPLLKKDTTSRRATIVFYNPKRDSVLFRKDIPSRIMMNFNLRQGELHLTEVVRSNDLFFGWPADIFQAHVLQAHIAKKLGCKPGTITTHSISAHIFKEQFEAIKKIIGNSES